MNKKIAFQYSGQPEHVGFMSIIKSLPNSFANTVGHFVFLDQIPYKTHKTEWLQKEISSKKQGSFAHPHRGIATVSYIIKGTVEHFDSAGNHGIVHDGGMQWMKAGKGIVHDESIHPNENNAITPFLGTQFWINLPAKNKNDNPEYRAVEATDIPTIMLPENKGKIKVVIGELGEVKAKIPTYSKLFLYHLELNSGKSHTLKIDKNDESAIALLTGKAIINTTAIAANDLLLFDNDGDTIEITNTSNNAINVMIFGGEPYTDPVVFGGPYVMNTQEEIVTSNNDFYAGKYGTINYNIAKT